MRIRVHVFLLPLLLLPCGAVAAKETPDEAYRQARLSYQALKTDRARRKLRHNWRNVVERFETLARSYPRSDRAPEALFTVGEILSDLSRISGDRQDLEDAIAAYNKLREGYPRHRLADDGALALAKIYLERKDDPNQARRVVRHALEKMPRGDQTPALRELSSNLPELVITRPERASPPASGRRVSRSEETRVREVTRTAPVPTSGPPGLRDALLGAIHRLGERGEVHQAKGVQPQPQPQPRAELARAPEPVPSDPESDPGASEDDAAPSAQAPETFPSLPPADALRTRLEEAVLPPVDGPGFSEQLGLKVRKVVIDPGHGGHDSGAVGRKGTKEKDVALAISLRVGRLLEQAGLQVEFTRTSDRFIALEERARFANHRKGDLFLSIHCNSAPTKGLRGIETYTLNTSSDRYSIKLAARENSASERGISDLQFILADLATKANVGDSGTLAQNVQQSLVRQLGTRYGGVKNLGTKQALFYVLMGARMPAVLVETSFLSHPEEEERLASRGYQEDVAQAIASGVREFVGARGQVARSP